MRNSLVVFRNSIAEARHLTSLFDFLTGNVRVPVPFDDLLRNQIAQVVGAFDKLLHDLIRIGMCEIFSGTRASTPRYQSESIPLQLHVALVSATIPPKEILFEQSVITKLSYLSFQHPEKISDGLSLIWNEKQKWAKIGLALGMTGEYASTQMKLIVSRRNAIVHESDMDPLTNAKTFISRDECEVISDFVERCGIAISNLVI
jgi:hypothetical protein